ncbi:Deoxyribose-phosphate aldolase 2 [compost metagenome]
MSVSLKSSSIFVLLYHPFIKGESSMSIANMIDHTLLRADAIKAEITKLTEEAKTYKFASVCVNPTWVAYSAEQLSGTDVKVCTVIGFPLGTTTTAVKAFETTDAIANGADEVDMVINVGALKAGDNELVEKDIQAVVNAASGKALVKVIIEACLLNDEEIERACELAVKAGADFVKTSTGFSTGGATVEDVALMRKTVGEQVGVKASGGIRGLDDMNKMIEAGATRIGASSGVKIMEGGQSTVSY